MKKPKIDDFVEPILRNGKVIANGIDFVKYAFALEEYIKFLEG